MSNTKRTNRKEGTMPTTIINSGLTEFKRNHESSIFAEWSVYRMVNRFDGIDFYNFRIGSPGDFFTHGHNPSRIPLTISYLHKRETDKMKISTIVAGDPIKFEKEDFDLVCEQIPQRTKEIIEMLDGMGEAK